MTNLSEALKSPEAVEAALDAYYNSYWPSSGPLEKMYRADMQSALSAALKVAERMVGVAIDEDGTARTAEELQRLLDDRDQFLVREGLFDKYAKQAGTVAERMVGEDYSDAELRDRVKWLESLFDFSDPEIVLNSAPNDSVTKDAVIVLRKHYEAKSDAKLREALVKARTSMLAVLCDPEGNCCIEGNDADRDVINRALAEIDAALASHAPAQEG